MSLLRRLFPCASCELREQQYDQTVRQFEAELERASEREKALMKEVHQLSDKLSAHADVTAHVAAVRAEADLEQGRSEPQKRRIGRLPPGVASLAARGHVDIRRFNEVRQPKVVVPDKVAKDPVPGVGG